MSKSVYEDAAKQAEADIPAKEAEIAELRRRLEIAQRELTLLRTAVSLASIGKYEIPSFTPQLSHEASELYKLASSELYSPQVAPSDKPKSPYIKMHEIFGKVYPRGLSVNEIIEAFSRDYNETVPTSTFYFSLNKGKRKGTFIEEGGKWRLAKKPT